MIIQMFKSLRRLHRIRHRRSKHQKTQKGKATSFPNK